MRPFGKFSIRVLGSERGSAIALVMLVAAFVAGVAYYAMTSSQQTRKNTQRVVDRITFVGLATALTPLVEDPNALFDGSSTQKNAKMERPLYNKTSTD